MNCCESNHLQNWNQLRNIKKRREFFLHLLFGDTNKEEKNKNYTNGLPQSSHDARHLDAVMVSCVFDHSHIDFGEWFFVIATCFATFLHAITFFSLSFKLQESIYRRIKERQLRQQEVDLQCQPRWMSGCVWVLFFYRANFYWKMWSNWVMPFIEIGVHMNGNANSIPKSC